MLLYPDSSADFITALLLQYELDTAPYGTDAKREGKTHFVSAVQLNCSDCSFIQNNKCAGDDMKSLLLFFLPLMGINPQRPMGDFFFMGFESLKQIRTLINHTLCSFFPGLFLF